MPTVITRSSNDYLEHHGILGQKWGKRNGPPYPLKAEDHSPSEEKAGWEKSLSGVSTEDLQKRKKEIQRDRNLRNNRTYSDTAIEKYREEKSKTNEKYKTYTKEQINSRMVLNDLKKDAAIALAIGVGAGVAYYAVRKYNFSKVANDLGIDPKDLTNLKKVYDATESKELLKQLSNVDTILKPGETFTRIEAFKDIDISKKDIPSYITNQLEDRLRYYSSLGNHAGSGSRFATKYEIINEIKAPSYDTYKEAFQNLVKQDKKFVELLSNEHFGKNELFDPEKIEEVLEDFNSTIGARDTKWLQDDKSLEKASDYFFKNLKKLGYNAVVDYNDTVGGSGGMGNNPMILLDAKNTVKKLSESKIRTLDQLSALDAEVESMFKMQGEYGEYLYEKYLGGMASNVDSFMEINVNPYLEAFGKKAIPQINDHYEEIGKAMADTVLTAKGAVKSIEEMTIPALAGTLLGANIGRQLANVSNKEKENQKDAEELKKINEELKKRK